MDPRLRTTLVFIVCSLVAVFLGWQVAEGSYAWAAVMSVAILATILVRFARIPADAIFIGFLIVGYIVGNRGFAQLMPPGLPLLPAEAGLLLAVGWRTILCAFERRLPFRNDPLNWAVLAWLVAGTVRVGFDVPEYRLLAIRDYAMVYYAVFFFVVQHMARMPKVRRYFTTCLTLATILLVPAYALFLAFPDFFTNQLTVLGMPLIYYKGDLAATYLAVGSLLIFHQARGLACYWAWPLSGLMLVYVISGDNRASLLGVTVASGLLLWARRWRFPALQGGLAVAGLLIVVLLATLSGNTWAEQKVLTLKERTRSLIDVSGTGRYESPDSLFKGDNNRFRLVWWKNVVTGTWSDNPVFGLGFGADLAHGFVQEYYPDSTEDFNVRSPHNIFLTIFGRMGIVGVTVWCIFCAILLAKTLRVLRQSVDPVPWSLWCGAWVILVSATFGVVLEGPMGAVIFWTLLGLASATELAAAENTELPTPAA